MRLSGVGYILEGDLHYASDEPEFDNENLTSFDHE